MLESVDDIFVQTEQKADEFVDGFAVVAGIICQHQGKPHGGMQQGWRYGGGMEHAEQAVGVEG